MRSIETRTDGGNTRNRVRHLAQEVMAELLELDPAHSKEILGTFVSELFLSVAEEERREFRRQRQAEGIADAKARGVRFGPQPKPLPEKFDECYEAWQNGQMTQAQAAEMCGISRQAFCRAVSRRGQEAVQR